MNRVSQTSFPFESSFLYLYDYVRVPFLNRIRVRCLKSSSFYFMGSNNNKGLTRKSKNRKKENGGITYICFCLFAIYFLTLALTLF